MTRTKVPRADVLSSGLCPCSKLIEIQDFVRKINVSASFTPLLPSEHLQREGNSGAMARTVPITNDKRNLGSEHSAAG